MSSAKLRSAPRASKTDAIASAIFDLGRNRVLVATNTQGPTVFDAKSGALLLTAKEQENMLVGIEAVSTDGRLALIRLGDTPLELRIWDTSTGDRVGSLSIGDMNLTKAAFVGEGALIVTWSSADNAISIWDRQSGTQLRKLTASQFGISADGRLLFAGEGKTGSVVSSETGTVICRFNDIEPRQNGTSVFSPDNKWVVMDLAGGEGGTVKLSSLVNCQTHRSFDYDATREDEQVFFSSENPFEEDRDLSIGSESAPTNTLIFDGTGQRLALVFDHDVQLWHTETGTFLGRIAAPVGKILGVSFSPDGARLAIAAGETTELKEIIRSGQALLEYARNIAPRCIGSNERAKFFLSRLPPRWCITGPGATREDSPEPKNWEGKFPYVTRKWKEWLLAKDRGDEIAMPNNELSISDE